MAYFTGASTAALRMISNGGAGGGLYTALSSAGNPGASIWGYNSSHSSTQVIATGFFTGVGAQPFSSSGPPHPNIVSRHANQVGVRAGDLLVNVESTNGATPGRVTWHCFTAPATWGGSTSIFSSTAGWDFTASAAAT